VNIFLSYLPGVILILFGILVALSPEILVVLISSFFIIVGVVMLLWARKFRQFFSKDGSMYRKSNVDIYIEK
jgi:uncharacterized membrane protein HdeD (DUF308 family)